MSERSEINLAFGTNVERERREQELNKKTFALMSGISRPFLDRVEHGTTDVRLSYVKKMADALCVKPADLLREPDGPDNPNDSWSPNRPESKPGRAKPGQAKRL